MLISALFLLVACAFSVKPSASIPPELLQPCQKLPTFEGRDMGGLLSYSVNMINLYKVCQTRQDALIKINKK